MDTNVTTIAPIGRSIGEEDMLASVQPQDMTPPPSGVTMHASHQVVYVPPEVAESLPQMQKDGQLPQNVGMPPSGGEMHEEFQPRDDEDVPTTAASAAIMLTPEFLTFSIWMSLAILTFLRCGFRKIFNRH